MNADSKKLKCLWVTQKPSESFENLLTNFFDVEQIGDISHWLRENHEVHDAVVIDPEMFRALASESFSGQAIDILNTINEAVLVLDRHDNILWANKMVKGFPDEIRQNISQQCSQGFAHFDNYLQDAGVDVQKLAPCKYGYFNDKANRYFEITVFAMPTDQSTVQQVAAVVRESTARRRLQQRIDAIDQAGRELVRLEAESFAQMTAEQRITLLQEKIIKYARKLLRFDNFAVWLVNSKKNKLEVLFALGIPIEYCQDIFVSPEGNGISGYVASTGRSYICNNPANDEHYLPGLSNSASSLTVPLRLNDKIIGVLNVESGTEKFFTEEDRQMAEIFGRYIAIAINILDLVVVERHQTTGQAVDMLNQCISEPVNRIISQASTCLDESIDPKELKQRLKQIIDSAGKIKTSVLQMQAGPRGIFDIANATAIGPEAALCGKKVLVADDEDFIRQTIADVVQRYGCIADTAADGQLAVNMLQQKQYDLVISDIKMPRITGYEVFSQARKLYPEIPVILMTGFGYDPNHSLVRANREGLDAILYKPFKADQLMEEVRKAFSS
ncbi:MAG: response regulator [Phycisphaerae bacterium]|nr:response regulator [Phycisphaerae bacterium]